MKKTVLLFALVFVTISSFCQLILWSPQFPVDTSTIIITLDATKGNRGLQGYTGAVFMHLGVITDKSITNSDWKYVPTEWATPTAPKATLSGANKWTFTLTNPRKYFNAPIGVPVNEIILKWALLFRDTLGNRVQKNTDGSDMFIPIYPQGNTNIKITTPPLQPTFNLSPEPFEILIGQSFPVTAIGSSTGTLSLYLNNILFAGPNSGSNSISGNAQVVRTGNQVVMAEMLDGGITVKDSISFYITPPSVKKNLPAGLKEGINYYGCSDSVTLVLYAPKKKNVAVIGEFPASNWLPQDQYQMFMTPDSTYFWLTIKGLTSATEYAYQYVVDGTIYIADPHCEKILDPYNDIYIPAKTYPNLKLYPGNPNVSASRNRFISVLQICEQGYDWKIQKFLKPDKRNLVIYELLLRDFSEAKNFQVVIDSINYFKKLGINAIEFMPLQEFSGNESWGYNPIFYFAPDKAYGTKNKLKEMVDTLHSNGIAVILDVVYNQMDAYYTPQGLMYWDPANGRPAVNSPWFNPTAKHPFNVFEDMNHESPATQYLVVSSLKHWLDEYKMDGFRFDLSKGFTQTFSTDVGTWGNEDQSRINNLNRYYDSIVPYYPETYMILEHFGVTSEENILATKGFMLWGNNNHAYSNAVMGWSGGNNSCTNFADNWNLGGAVYNSGTKGYTKPASVGYMESHDEDRVAYRSLKCGNNNGSFNAKSKTEYLKRTEAAGALFFTIPGPKMIWQFGELGYDTSIYRCGNGTVSTTGGCRTDNKPPLWNYLNDPDRVALFNAWSKMINLRISNQEVFNNTSFSSSVTNAFKRFIISDPSGKGMSVAAIANFDMVPLSAVVTFPKTGEWFNYSSNNTTGTGSTNAGLNGTTNSKFTITTSSQNVNLGPGEYHIYIFLPSNLYVFNGSGNWTDAANWMYGKIPPAILPSGSEIQIKPTTAGECVMNISQTISAGAKLIISQNKKIKIPLNLIIQ